MITGSIAALAKTDANKADGTLEILFFENKYQ